jgi:hypothetical protein
MKKGIWAKQELSWRAAQKATFSTKSRWKDPRTRTTFLTCIVRFLELRGDDRGERFSRGKGRVGISGFFIRLCSQIEKKREKKAGDWEVELKLPRYVG